MSLSLSLPLSLPPSLSFSLSLSVSLVFGADDTECRWFESRFTFYQMNPSLPNDRIIWKYMTSNKVTSINNTSIGHIFYQTAPTLYNSDNRETQITGQAEVGRLLFLRPLASWQERIIWSIKAHYLQCLSTAKIIKCSLAMNKQKKQAGVHIMCPVASNRRVAVGVKQKQVSKQASLQQSTALKEIQNTSLTLLILWPFERAWQWMEEIQWSHCCHHSYANTVFIIHKYMWTYKYYLSTMSSTVELLFHNYPHPTRIKCIYVKKENQNQIKLVSRKS